MALYASGRAGLGLRYAVGERLGADDLNHLADTLAATRGVLGGLLGGPGVVAGGAASVADLAGGASYPAVTLVVADATGSLWLYRTAAPTPIDYQLSDGAGEVWAVPGLVEGVSPAVAAGGLTQVRFVCQAAADPAPAHGLRLGAGVVVGGRLSTYTVASGAAVAPVAGPLGVARWAHFGPPVGGVAGAVGEDRGGARWRYAGGGWVQQSAARATVWSGGGADDVTAAANYAGPVPGGYRVVEPAPGAAWRWDAGLARWLGREVALGLTVAFAARTTDGVYPGGMISTLTDALPLRALMMGSAAGGAYDAANCWSITMAIDSLVVAEHLAQAPGSYTVEMPLARAVVSTLGGPARVTQAQTRTGVPPSLTMFGGVLTYQEVRQ